MNKEPLMIPLEKFLCHVCNHDLYKMYHDRCYSDGFVCCYKPACLARLRDFLEDSMDLLPAPDATIQKEKDME